MLYRILVVIIFVGVNANYCTYARAQISKGDVISLTDAVSAAIEFNPELSSYPLRRESLLGQGESAALKPSLNINVELENIIGTGDLSGIDRAESSLVLSRVIEMGNKRSTRVAVANRRVDLLDAQKHVAELDLMATTAFHFIDVLAAQERLRLQLQAVQLAEQTISLLTPLVNAGQTPQLEVGRANAGLYRARIAEDFARSSLASSRLKLSTMWGSQSPAFASATADFFSMEAAGSLNSILLNLSNNPNVAIYADEQRLLSAQLQEARTQSQTNIQWSAGIRHLKEIDDFGLIFSISAPLFNSSRSAGAVRSAQANLSEVEARRQNSLNAIRGQLSSLHEQLTQAISETSILQAEVLPLLSDVLRQTRDAYASGRYSYIDLISAQQEYLDAELALINSATNAHTLRIEIEKLSGEPLTRY